MTSKQDEWLKHAHPWEPIVLTSEVTHRPARRLNYTIIGMIIAVLFDALCWILPPMIHAIQQWAK